MRVTAGKPTVSGGPDYRGNVRAVGDQVGSRVGKAIGGAIGEDQGKYGGVGAPSAKASKAFEIFETASNVVTGVNVVKGVVKAASSAAKGVQKVLQGATDPHVAL